MSSIMTPFANSNQHHQRMSFQSFLDTQQRLNWREFELWCGCPHIALDAMTPQEARQVKHQIDSRNLQVVSLTSPSMGIPYQYADTDIHGALRYFKRGIDLASYLGAGICTVNSGWGLRGEERASAWARSQTILGTLAEYAHERNVVLALESLRPDESNLVNSLDSAHQMWQEVHHPALQMMVDNIATGAVGESLQDWFDAFGTALVHMHFIDGNPWVHQIWGEGNTSLGAQIDVIRRNHYQGYLVQEIAEERFYDDPGYYDRANQLALRPWAAMLQSTIH